MGGSLTILGVSVLTLFRRRDPFELADDDEPVVRYVPPPREPAPFGVVTLQLGLDAEARARVQRGLATLAQSLPLGEAEGRLQALRATLVLLNGNAESVAYESGEVRPGLDKAKARRFFTERTTDLRARFRDELVRRVDHALLRQGSSSVRALPEEGDGFVVVSIVAAARRLASPTQVGFEAAAGALMPLTEKDLVAFEVVWSPAADTDRMSSLELEVLYPELVRVGRDVGRVVCACGVAYAAELGKCPSCGRPVAEATAASA